MKKTLLSVVFLCFATGVEAEGVHFYQNDAGETILSNQTPSQMRNNARFSEFKYSSSTQFVDRKVTVPARKIYENGLCKMGQDLVPCYKYQKTIPAHTATESVPKHVVLSPEQLEQIEKQ